MHPNTAFHDHDRARAAALVEQVRFAMVFAATPDGPRVAHTPVHLTGDGALQFHLARGNALTRHLGGSDVVVVVNGPDAYVSPDWYVSEGQVPTWNYLAVEMEGRVRRMDDDGLAGLLDDLAAAEEAKLAPKPVWTRDKMEPGRFEKMLRGITGFEMEIKAWRLTAKLSQNKDAADRQGAIAGLEATGRRAVAELMRGWEAAAK